MSTSIKQARVQIEMVYFGCNLYSKDNGETQLTDSIQTKGINPNTKVLKSNVQLHVMNYSITFYKNKGLIDLYSC